MAVFHARTVSQISSIKNQLDVGGEAGRSNSGIRQSQETCTFSNHNTSVVFLL